MFRDPQPAGSDLALGRRRFLMWAAAGVASAALPVRAFALAQQRPAAQTRALSFFHMHTLERLDVVYRSGRGYDRQALARINRILRDHRTGEVQPIDTDLLDLLHALRKRLHTEEPYHVISGYRSRRTNERLRAQGRGVASKSLHVQGKAVDVFLPGCELARLRDAVMEAEAGGVGYYPGPGFVHVDVGNVRSW